MALIGDIGDYFTSDKIDHPDFVPFSLKNHKVVVIPVIVLTVDHKSSSKSGYSAVVLVFFRHSADHLDLLPSVDALCDMGLVCGVLKVVYEDLLAILVQDISVEECDVLRTDCCVDGEKGSVDLVDPV